MESMWGRWEEISEMAFCRMEEIRELCTICTGQKTTSELTEGSVMHEAEDYRVILIRPEVAAREAEYRAA